MISVVVCSINPSLALQLEKNIQQTIGVPFEMIVIDNRELKKGINAVYNIGASQATYDIICFLHEDIVFNSFEWGQVLSKLFSENERLGLIGIAGAKYKSRNDSGWYTGISAFDCCNIIHLDKNGQQKKMYANPIDGSHYQPVVVVDGVFMCSRKSVWNTIKFDETLLKGFHFYDIDYSFRVSQQFETVVSFQIDITHFTQGGDFGNNWIQYAEIWHDQYQHKLPFSIDPVKNEESKVFELKIADTWLNLLMKEKVSFGFRLKWLRRIGVKVSVKLLMPVIRFLVYDLLKWALVKKKA